MRTGVAPAWFLRAVLPAAVLGILPWTTWWSRERPRFCLPRHVIIHAFQAKVRTVSYHQAMCCSTSLRCAGARLRCAFARSSEP